MTILIIVLTANAIIWGMFASPLGASPAKYAVLGLAAMNGLAAGYAYYLSL